MHMERRQIRSGGGRWTAAHAFFLGALLAVIALGPAIWPYGGRYVTRGDYIEQQLPFILETGRMLRGGLNSYSFNTFLGAPSVGSYAFYTMGSVFVWPLALLPKALVPLGISVMAVLKHAVCALTSFLYLRKMTNNARLSLMGSVLYTFSAFTVINTQFYHFTEVVAFFPLILLGMEIVMRGERRPGLLALSCGLNALTNYYFMLSSAILAALYFVFRFFGEDWKNKRIVRSVQTVFECGVGCALSGVILLPAMLFMLSITRTGAGGTPVLEQTYSLSVLLERARTLLMPIESGVLHAYYGDAGSWTSTAVYLPVFGLTGVLVCFMKKGHGWLKALLIALGVCCVVPALCGAFALFTNTGYTRWWYGLALMLALATVYALRDAKITKNRRVWMAAFAVCSLAVAVLMVPFLMPESWLRAMEGGALGRIASAILLRRTGAYAPDALRVLSVVLTLLCGGAMLILITKTKRFGAALALVCACACACYAGYIAVGDRVILSGGETAESGVYELADIAEPTLAALELDDKDGFTRIDYGKRLRNYGLLRGASSLRSFMSLRASLVGRFVSMMGFGWDESTTVAPPDNAAPIRALLSVTEYHRFDGEDVPEGFVYSHDENGFAVYTNPNAVPMGFLQTVCTGTHHQPMDSQNAPIVMLAAATMEDAELEKYGDKMEKLDVYNIPDWQESVARLKENACDSFETRSDGFTAHIDAKEAGLVVFTIPFDKGFSATVDGEDSEVVLCDVAFMGVWVEPGEHTIEFTYKTRMLGFGAAMSALAAAVLAGYVVMAKRKKIG